MNFNFFKNIQPIYFYLISISGFVFANIIREKNPFIYGVALAVGLVFFLLGLLNRISKK
jgi:hypothetical protein